MVFFVFANMCDAKADQKDQASTSLSKYRVSVERIRLLNRRTIGLYIQIDDEIGRTYRLKASSVRKLGINNQNATYWNLDWQTQIPYKGIKKISGLERFISNNGRYFGVVNNAIASSHRIANRLQINVNPDPSVQGDNFIKSTADDSEFQTMALMAVDILGQNSAQQIKINQDSIKVRKLVSLIKNKFNLQNDKSASTNSTNDVTGESDEKPSPQALFAFSKIKNAYFLNAALADPNDHSTPRIYYYKPSGLTLKSHHSIVLPQSFSGIPEAISVLDNYEQEKGINLLLINLTEQDFKQPFVKLSTVIKTPDQANHTLKLDLGIQKELQDKYQCSPQNCELTANLDYADRELLSYWLNNTTSSTWTKLDKELKQLQNSGNFLGVATLIEENFQKKENWKTIPLPLVSDWSFYAAEAYRSANDTAKALEWYRRIVKQKPLSPYHQKSWYQITTINMKKGIFNKNNK